MVLFFVDKKWLRKKEKGHLVEYYMTRYTASHTTCLSKMAAEQSQTTMLTCKAILVVNHPEIALTLKKCFNSR